MFRAGVRRTIAVSALPFVAACSDRASDPVVSPSPESPASTAIAVSCTANVRSGKVTCGAPAGATGRSDLIVGGQNAYVQLASSNIAVVADTFTFDVTVQNLIPQAMGTTDGSTPDAAGVRVFFNVAPTPINGSTGSIEVANADGTGTFLQADQAYYQYDGILAPNATSGAKQWRFRFDPTVAEFGFLVYVATAVQYPQGFVDLAVDSLAVAEGGSGALTASAFRAVAAEPAAPISWSSADTTVATVDVGGLVTGVRPGVTTIQATAVTSLGDTVSGTAKVAVCLSLDLGEVYTAAMPDASNLCVAGGGAATEFTYMPVNVSGSASVSLSVTPTGIQAVTGPPTPNLIPTASLGLASPRTSMLEAEATTRMARRIADRRSTAGLVGRRDALIGTGGARRAITPGVPAVNDLWSLNVASGCSGSLDLRTGRVRTVSARTIVVADTANPAGGFTTAQYDSIALEFDSIAYPTLTANFGAPTDRDGNSRIVLFFTRAMNELSPPASSVITNAEFRSSDLFDASPSGCERSNAGEIIYMLVPDPTGAVNSNVRTVSSVRGAVIRSSGNEFQSLINASRRLYVQNAPSLEEPWLDAGLSRVAEELMFYRTSVGLTPRSNIIVTNLTTGPNASRRVAAYNTYANANFGAFRAWLQRPDTSGAFRTNNTLAQQGATWAFLRYAADRVGGTEASFWASLVDSDLTGKANIAAAINADADQWMADWVTAMYADDAVTGIGAQYTTLSWNYRSLYGALNGSYQLVPRTFTNNTTLTLSYSRDGGAIFGRFGIPASGFATVTTLSGGLPPTSTVLLRIVRTK